MYKFSITLVFLYLCLSLPAQQKKTNDKVASIISNHPIVFNHPPTKIPNTVSVDAPLLGNGSIAAALSGKPEKQVYHLARNDFWRLKSDYDQSFPTMAGKLVIEMPALKKAVYKVEQNIYQAITTASFSNTTNTVEIKSYVAATADLLLIEIYNKGKNNLPVSVQLVLPEAEDFVNQSRDNVLPAETSTGTSNNISWITRAFVKDVDIPTKAACGVKLLGDGFKNNNLAPGKKLLVVCALSGNFKSDDCLQTVMHTLSNFNSDTTQAINQAHTNWWKNFWHKSWINIPDAAIEKMYYTSQYTLASCSRDKNFPPSLFGSWITKERPDWNADYHLNYNHMAPYYGLYASNHIEQADPYYAPLLAFAERGKYYAQKITGIKDGIMLPVGIGPLGIETTRKTANMERKDPDFIKGGHTEDEGLFWGQKSNAAYAVVDMSMQFYYTYDTAYTQKVYPFVKAVATFWDGYLKLENGMYEIYNDAIHEGTLGDKNPILSLGLVRMVMRTAIDMGTLLNTDKERYARWEDIFNRLAVYPVQQRNGRKVFRYTTEGTAWVDGNTLGIQHIYPAGQINIDSEPEWVNVAKNTISEMSRWLDMNGSNSFFPAAVRVGYNANTILYQLNKYVKHTYPNGFQLNNPHGIENCSTVPNTINEMLCMSAGGVIRLFAVWPNNKNASFNTLRAEGAFLVSASLTKGTIGSVKIFSEKGRECVLRNPWKDRKVVVKTNDGKTQILSGTTVLFATVAGEEYTIQPL
ncbi:MAG: hypothetical protein QM802_19215 [Agriterribacter sp.]